MSALDVIEGRKLWTVICADNREVLPTLPAKSVTHVITDPPYSEHVHGKQRRMLRGSGGLPAKDGAKRGEIIGKPLGFDALGEDHRDFCSNRFADICQRWCLVFSDLESTEAWLSSMVVSGLRRWRFGIWNKLNCQPQLSGTGPAVGFEGIAFVL